MVLSFSPSTPKLVNFPHFFWLARVWEKHVNTKSLRKKHVNTKTNQFCHIFWTRRSLRKNMSTPNLVNFHHFLDSRSLRETCHIPYTSHMYHHVYMHVQFKPFWEEDIVFRSNFTLVHIFTLYVWYMQDGSESFSPSTPKLVNFPHFLDLHEFEKKHVNTKTSQFSPWKKVSVRQHQN